jgi:hypothetical protein
MDRMRIAFATCSLVPEGLPDDAEAAGLLRAEVHPWDDPTVRWDSFDRVVVRSVFDYAQRLDQFLAWCHSIGGERLRNTPELVSFNADKRYLSDLRSPVVQTAFIAPGEPAQLVGEVVVKPNISAAAGDTGRFGPTARQAAFDLIDRIHASGRVALVQPYLPSVDERGETSLVYFGGRLSHVLRKRAVLRPDEVAPLALEGPGRDLRVAQVMLDPTLVVAGKAAPAELELGRRAHAEIADRFGTPLLLRIDLANDANGDPVVMELEAIEPVLYLATQAGAAQAFAEAVRTS